MKNILFTILLVLCYSALQAQSKPAKIDPVDAVMNTLLFNNMHPITVPSTSPVIIQHPTNKSTTMSNTVVVPVIQINFPKFTAITTINSNGTSSYRSIITY